MKKLGIVLVIAGIGFCVAGFMGHTGAWAGAALSLFAASMLISSVPLIVVRFFSVREVSVYNF